MRELKNAIERALVLGESTTIEEADLLEIAHRAPSPNDPPAPWLGEPPQTLEVMEARAVQAAPRATGGNRARAAAMLGISRVTLYKKLQEDRPQGAVSSSARKSAASSGSAR